MDERRKNNSWPHSEVFSESMFGGAIDNDGNILTFRDEYLSSLHDKKEVFVNELVDPSHSPYGFIESSFNYEVGVGVLR